MKIKIITSFLLASSLLTSSFAAEKKVVNDKVTNLLTQHSFSLLETPEKEGGDVIIREEAIQSAKPKDLPELFLLNGRVFKMQDVQEPGTPGDDGFFSALGLFREDAALVLLENVEMQNARLMTVNEIVTRFLNNFPIPQSLEKLVDFSQFKQKLEKAGEKERNEILEELRIAVSTPDVFVAFSKEMKDPNFKMTVLEKPISNHDFLCLGVIDAVAYLHRFGLKIYTIQSPSGKDDPYLVKPFHSFVHKDIKQIKYLVWNKDKHVFYGLTPDKNTPKERVPGNFLDPWGDKPYMAKVTFLDEKSTVKETVKQSKEPVVLAKSIFDDVTPVKMKAPIKQDSKPPIPSQKGDDDLYVD